MEIVDGSTLSLLKRPDGFYHCILQAPTNGTPAELVPSFEPQHDGGFLAGRRRRRRQVIPKTRRHLPEVGGL